MAWHQLPEDAGQIVERHWAAAGILGAICRTVDRSESSPQPVYRLHRSDSATIDP